MEGLLESEEFVIEAMMEVDAEGHTEVLERVLELVDLGNTDVIWMLGRNLYHVAFSRPHALIELLELAKLIDQKIPDGLRDEWRQSLSVSVVSECLDEDSSRSFYFTPHESNYFFGFLSTIGVADVCGRLQALEPLYLDEECVSHRLVMKTLVHLMPSNRTTIKERFPKIYEVFRRYLERMPHLLSELDAMEKHDIDGLVATPSRVSGFDPQCASLISMDAYILMIISADDVELLKVLSAQPGFDVNMRLKKSLVAPTSSLCHQLTLIHVAAFYGAINCFRFLVMNNASLFLSDVRRFGNERDLVDFAVMGGNIEILRNCVQNGLPLKDAAHTAVAYHRNDVFHWLLENGNCTLGDTDEDGLTLMNMAASCNNIAIARYLYDHNAAPPIDDREDRPSPLFQACSVDCLSIVHLICTREPSIADDVIVGAMKSAISGNSLDVLKYLVEHYRSVVTPPVLSSLIQQAEKSGFSRTSQLLRAYSSE